jgi:hypothetical protein
LKPGLARQVDPRLKSGRVGKKIEKKKIRYDPVDPAKPDCNLLIFIYFLLK